MSENVGLLFNWGGGGGPTWENDGKNGLILNGKINTQIEVTVNTGFYFIFPILLIFFLCGIIVIFLMGSFKFSNVSKNCTICQGITVLGKYIDSINIFSKRGQYLG